MRNRANSCDGLLRPTAEASSTHGHLRGHLPDTAQGVVRAHAAARALFPPMARAEGNRWPPPAAQARVPDG
eukprot:10531605-Alexandrium_andersonii.AAC.1